MKMVGDKREWFAPVLAGVAFLVLVFAFYVSVKVYKLSIYHDAMRELESRAELAARTLVEPLRTLDFARVYAFGETSRERGYELSIETGSHGLIFDTRRERRTNSTEYWLGSSAKCGEYELFLMRDRREVFAPYDRVFRVFILAVLVGASGMFIVFFVLYRQRVRIRELASIERFRRDFIADVSHEIKTPLTGILGGVEMLEDAQGDAGQRQTLLALIKKESVRLQRLVQAILDLARLERENSHLVHEPFDLGELMQQLAKRYGVALGGVGAPVMASGDVDLVRQALANLIENAKRHSGTDDITLSLAVGDRRVTVAVEDHGVGIPLKHAERVFERFYRVDEARSATTGGAGLGLAIVRRIARLHGGDATLEAVSPHGCRFAFTLPRCELQVGDNVN